EVLQEIKRAYKFIYKSNLLKKEALEKIRKELHLFPEIEHLIHFVENS
ncbi:MAG: acyl-[acyl-carrier-protein]--UDP-N-acetylglucosamine O-acyltransferase, partial [Aliifodinibius sp.]|nr:acyl-[acyl-carrier-protein]--UDP-N-acetylglucosamine O-acyltransferase [Fodinibius sp.]